MENHFDEISDDRLDLVLDTYISKYFEDFPEKQFDYKHFLDHCQCYEGWMRNTRAAYNGD